MKPKVLVTRKIPDDALELLKRECELTVWNEEDEPMPREELLEAVSQVEGIYSLLSDKIDSKVIECAPNLKVVSNMAVGYDNIDVAKCDEKGIMVTNTPGVLTEATADLSFALLMATARRVVEASEYLREGQWKSWSPMQLTGQDVFGATIGIIGMGRIGEAVARRALGFNMEVLYHNRNRKQQVESELGVSYRDLDDLLKESDFVVLLTPLTPETKGLIKSRELSLMKSSAVLINVARGSIVDEGALYNSLKNNEIWAAGLDVFEQEPIDLKHPLLSLENVVTLPHIGSASIKTRKKMALMTAENLISALQGEMPPNLVNKASK